MIKEALGILAFFTPPPLNKYIHKWRGVVFEDIGSTWIGFATIIDNAYPEKIKIGKNVTISTAVKIYAHTEPPKSIQERFFPMQVKDVIIGSNVFIGTNACILPGVVIEDWSMVAAGAIVTKRVESFSLVAGNPAKKIKDLK